jgi:hypothetical protein
MKDIGPVAHQAFLGRIVQLFPSFPRYFKCMKHNIFFVAKKYCEYYIFV